MESFKYYSPANIIFGIGERKNLGKYMGNYKKALLVVAKGPFRSNGVLDEIKNVLNASGIETVEMGDIDSNPRLSSVREGAEVAKKSGADCVVGIGGGSAMDCAKLIAGAAKSDEDPYDFLWGKRIPIEDALDIVLIPTFAATGTEVHQYGVIVNDETKQKWYCAVKFPSITLMDPELTVSVPLKLTIWGAMDILSHTFEFYFNNNTSSEFQSRFSEAIILATMNAVERLVADPQDLNARGELMYAAIMAWGGLTKIGRGDADMACHFIEESFSGYFDTHHGGCLGVLTPRWMDSVLEDVPAPFARFGRNVFRLDGSSDVEVAKKAVESFKAWLKKIGAPNTFSDLGDRDFSDKQLKYVATTACNIYGGSVGKIKKFNAGEAFGLLKLGTIAY